MWFRLIFMGLLSAPLWGAECKCPKTDPKDLLETATSAFRGTLADIRTPKNGPVVYSFDVLDTFKGDPHLEFDVQDADSGTPCALTLEKDKEYLVYARWQWGWEKTSRCWGTKEVEQAKSDQSVLGPGDEWKEKLYPKLRETCMGRYDTSCCLASIKAMEQGHYLPEDEDGCPDGFQPNVVNCKGSRRWCEPIAGNTVPSAYHHP